MIETTESKEAPKNKNSTPDEQGGFLFSSVLKIIDPVSKEILVHKRGDD